MPSKFVVLMQQRSFSGAFPSLLSTDPLDHSEAVTISAFVLSGDTLQAKIEFHGPVAPLEVSGAAELVERAAAYHPRRSERSGVHFTEDVDFDHLSLMSGATMDDDDAIWEDDDDKPAETEEEKAAALERRKKKREMQRQKALEARQRREQLETEQKKKLREEGEPFEKVCLVLEDGRGS